MRLRILQKSPDSSGFWAWVGAFFGSFDYAQILAIVMLLSFGLVFIRSTGEQVGTAQYLGFFWKQLTWVGVGLAAWIFFAVSDYRKLEPLSWLVYIIAIVLLVAVLIWGPSIYDAKRWLILNFVVFKQQLQPSEFGKIGLILVLASTLGNRNFNVDSWRHLAVIAGLIALPFALVVVEPDLGGAVIFLPIAAAMIFCAGFSWRKILQFGAVVVVVGGVLVTNEILQIAPLLHQYQKNRIQTFLNPAKDISGRDYNSYQARLAVGSGGLAGKGIGQGTQNALGFLPQTVANNDFIFSVIAEETGFVGGLLLIGMMGLLIYTTFRTAWLADTPYGRYLAVGFGVMLFMHTFVNIGMSVGLAPVKGTPLPLVSYGGSFAVTTMSMLGVIQSIYRCSKREEAL